MTIFKVIGRSKTFNLACELSRREVTSSNFYLLLLLFWLIASDKGNSCCLCIMTGRFCYIRNTIKFRLTSYMVLGNFLSEYVVKA